MQYNIRKNNTEVVKSVFKWAISNPHTKNVAKLVPANDFQSVIESEKEIPFYDLIELINDKSMEYFRIRKKDGVLIIDISIPTDYLEYILSVGLEESYFEDLDEVYNLYRVD